VASPVFDAFARSDFLGKLIFLSLGALSVLSWVIIVYKLWLATIVDRTALHIHQFFKKHARTPLNVDFNHFDNQTGVHNPFLSLYKVLKMQVVDLLKKNKELTGMSGAKAVFLSSTDIEQIGSQVDMTIYIEKKRLEKYLFVLSTIFSLAPLLGLLGTVWGISITFNQLPNSSNALSNDAVLSGLAMALGTTFFGILVAIPALIFYHYLKHRIEDYTDRMDLFSSDILHSVEMQYRVVDV